jgi:hypothetical protein
MKIPPNCREVRIVNQKPCDFRFHVEGDTLIIHTHCRKHKGFDRAPLTLTRDASNGPLEPTH